MPKKRNYNINELMSNRPFVDYYRSEAGQRNHAEGRLRKNLETKGVKDSQSKQSLEISDAVPRRADNSTPEEAVKKTHRGRQISPMDHLMLEVGGKKI